MKKARGDARINANRSVWVEYLAVWLLILCLTGGQALILSEYIDLRSVDVPASFILANIGYWGLMAFLFCLITRAMRRRKYDKPMKKLSEAARQVAGGDFSVWIEPLRKDGKKDYVEVMFDDFNKMVEELGTLETMKTDFISNVSHEIKTPIAVIQNYASALQRMNVTPEDHIEYTSTIIAASQKLNTLVSNILKLSKLENQAIAPELEEYDLCAQLAECALSFETLWETKGISFTADMDDRALVRADRGMLEIVWNNLLSNALKFTEPGGAVTLSQTSDGHAVTVAVADTGSGMDAKTLNRAFDKFYQGDGSRSQEGNGLGLALALRVVEILGGKISAKSAPGEGSVFTVTLKTEPLNS